MRRYAKPLASLEYRHRKITVDAAGMFRVGDGDDGDSHATLSAAHKAIDEAYSLEVKAAKVKLSLPIVSDAGTKHVITGLNAGTGKITTNPPLQKITERYGSRSLPDIYPDVPGVAEAIARRDAIKAELEATTEWLRGLQVETWGSVRTADDIKEKTDELQKSYKAACAAAKKPIAKAVSP